MCFGSSKSSNTKPPEPTPPTTFSYRAGADSLKAQQQQAVATGQVTAPPALGSELGTSGGAMRNGVNTFGDVNYGAGGAAY